MITIFHLPTKIIFGPGSLERLGVEARKIGRKAILVCGSTSMRKAGVLDKVITDLRDKNVETLVFDRVESNPRTAMVDEGARVARGVDLVIGLGGGSAMDSAKAIALASSGTAPLWDYVEARRKVGAGDSIPAIIQVPTVAASGSEVNGGAVITNRETKEKRVLFSPHIFARVAIIDPALTLTLSERTTMQGGVDIFCHLAESYLTTRSPSPLTDGIMETTMRLVVETLPQALARLNDIEMRTRLSWASTIACSQFTRLGGGSGYMTLHGIEHPLSGYYDIAHGDGLAALLPAWMRYTIPAQPKRFQSLGENVFGESDAIKATEKWLERVGMKLRLRELGIEFECIEEMAGSAVMTAPWLKEHPRLLDAAAITQIYRESY
ncbi:iron-containing alcohol dehydrogenase [Chloroflexota bacterium]